MALVAFAASASAQEAPPGFEIRSLNGVRVWSPKPQPAPPPPQVIERQTVVIERVVPVPAEPPEPTVTLVPVPIYGPKPHKPVARPLLPLRFLPPTSRH